MLKSKENINFNSTICQYYSGVVVDVSVKGIFSIIYMNCYLIIPLHGSQPNRGKGACITSMKSYEPCCAGPSKMDRS